MINKRIIGMFQFTGYFYMFTKLITSIVLILVIFFMGYVILLSYKNNNSDEQNYEFITKKLFNKIDENNKQIIQLTNNLNNIQKKLEANQPTVSKLKYDNDIKKIINSSNELKKQIKELSLVFKNNQEVKKSKNNNIALEVDSIVDLIIIRYKNFQKITDELLYLESVLPEEKKYLLEKIYSINFNNFYGMKNLREEFNKSTESYVNLKFLENNKNKVMNFFYKFVTVRPSNLSVYENEDLNILMKAKKFMEIGDISDSLIEIKKLEDAINYFENYIYQSEIFLDFYVSLEKVK